MKQRPFIAALLLGLALTLAQAAGLNEKAPAFTLFDLRHQKHSLAEYKGKVVFINFWASWCAPCKIELPNLERLAAGYKGKPVQIIAINVDRERPEAQKLIHRMGLGNASMPIFWDTEGKIVAAYNIDGMPASFILDARGIIRFTHVGFHAQDPARWRQEINQLLNPSTPA
jgi:cytochrome c biogenesis protein CcmG/thiol:disulfide interchange protein DsbE